MFGAGKFTSSLTYLRMELEVVEVGLHLSFFPFFFFEKHWHKNKWEKHFTISNLMNFERKIL